MSNRLFFFLCSAIVAIVFTGLMIIPTIFFGVTHVYAQQQQQQQSSASDDQRPHDFGGPRYPVPYGQQQPPPHAQAGNFSFGPIASIQNDESGQPAWVVVGYWRGNLLSFNETTTTAAAATTNTTTQNSNGNTSSPAVFNTDFRMIMLNGSAPHTHVVTNFILSNVSPNENGTMTYTGNSTVSMPEAPIVDVPTTIKVSGEIISIFPDPSAVNHHFGNTPIYGVVLPEEDQRRGHNYGGPPPSLPP
jgi:hypothetical protein